MRTMPSAPVERYDVNGTLNFVTSESNRRYIAPGDELNTGTYEKRVVRTHDARPSATS